MLMFFTNKFCTVKNISNLCIRKTSPTDTTRADTAAAVFP